MAETELNVKTLFDALVAEADTIDDNIVWEHPRCETRAVRTITDTGLQLAIGYFNNSAPRLGTPKGAKDTYSITTYPGHPRHLYHRVQLNQGMHSYSHAELIEDDSYDYIEGLDNFPELISSRRLEQPGIARWIRAHVLGAYIIDVETGEDLNNRTRQRSIVHAQATGREIIDSGGYVTQIDAAFLDQFAA